MTDYNKSICVEDFCGYTGIGHFPVQFWADFYPDMLTTYFGGDWNFVPPLHTEAQPDNETVNRWAYYHEAMI